MSWRVVINLPRNAFVLGLRLQEGEFRRGSLDTNAFRLIHVQGAIRDLLNWLLLACSKETVRDENRVRQLNVTSRLRNFSRAWHGMYAVIPVDSGDGKMMRRACQVTFDI
jgi:hypothetical protein